MDMSKLKPITFRLLIEDDDNYWIAETAVGEYYIDKKREAAVWYLTLGEGEIVPSQPCDSIEAGKAACSADYRNRVAGLFEE